MPKGFNPFKRKKTTNPSEEGSSSNPHTDSLFSPVQSSDGAFDGFFFKTLDQALLWYGDFSMRSICTGAPIKWTVFPDHRPLFEALGLRQLVTLRFPVATNAIRLFYCNIQLNTFDVSTRVGGLDIEFNDVLLAEILGVSNDGAPLDDITEFDFPDGTTLASFKAELCAPDPVRPGKFKAKNMNLFSYELHRIIYSTLLPKSTSKDDVTSLELSAMYHILKGIPFSAPKTIIQMMGRCRARDRNLCYAMLIPRIFQRFDIDLSTCTMESEPMFLQLSRRSLAAATAPPAPAPAPAPVPPPPQQYAMTFEGIHQHLSALHVSITDAAREREFRDVTRYQAIANSLADLRFAQTGHSAGSIPRDPAFSGYRCEDEAVHTYFQPGNTYDWYRGFGATPHPSGAGTSGAGPSGHAGHADDSDDDEEM